MGLQTALGYAVAAPGAWMGAVLAPDAFDVAFYRSGDEPVWTMVSLKAVFELYEHTVAERPLNSLDFGIVPRNGGIEFEYGGIGDDVCLQTTYGELRSATERLLGEVFQHLNDVSDSESRERAVDKMTGKIRKPRDIYSEIHNIHQGSE